MATDQEKKIARAYNIGYALSVHEPKLLEKIIRQNPGNEFVKAMAVAKDHHEYAAGIPRKDHTREFKNGFRNARTLAEHDPELIKKLIASKDTNKEYKAGLEAGQREYAIRETMKRMQREREQQQELDRDRGIEL